MARTRGEKTPTYGIKSSTKPPSDVYVGMLGLTAFAMFVGVLALFIESTEYDTSKPPAAPAYALPKSEPLPEVAGANAMNTPLWPDATAAAPDPVVPVAAPPAVVAAVPPAAVPPAAVPANPPVAYAPGSPVAPVPSPLMLPAAPFAPVPTVPTANTRPVGPVPSPLVVPGPVPSPLVIPAPGR